MGQDTSNNTSTGNKKIETGHGMDPQVSIAAIGAKAAVIVAVIGLIGTLTGLFLNYLQWFSSLPTPVPTTIIPVISSSSTFVAASSPTLEESILPVETSTPEIVPSNTVTPSPTSSETAVMYVSIAASQTTGKAPFTAKFDARGSYVQAPDGTIYECSRGACRYSWYIFLNGQDFAKPDTTSGTLEFRFQQRGTYSISVYICHGSKSPTCGNGATLVIAN